MPSNSRWSRRPGRCDARLAVSLALLCLPLPAGATGEAADPRLALGRQLFGELAAPACSLCHSLRDAGAEGAIGPNLDRLRPSAAQVVAAVRGGLGVMPSYADSLDKAQIEALAHYVAEVAGR